MAEHLVVFHPKWLSDRAISVTAGNLITVYESIPFWITPQLKTVFVDGLRSHLFKATFTFSLGFPGGERKSHELAKACGCVHCFIMASVKVSEVFTYISMSVIIIIVLCTKEAAGDCERHLPTENDSNDVNASVRVLSGIPANPTDFDNIVTIAFDNDQGNRDYNCIGSLIAPSWVLTAAQCFISPGRNYVLHGGGNSLSGSTYFIAEVVPHPDWGTVTGSGEARPLGHDDIQLVRLQSSVAGSDPTSSSNDTSNATPGPVSRQSNTSTSPGFNFMRINNNSAFVVPPAPMQYLRFKGYGLMERPENNEQPIQEVPRALTFADLKTTACPSPFRDDGQRRVCTVGDSSCGPCYGDIGGPLYGVDASGTVSALVGILSFGRNAASNTSICSNDEPVIYTAVSPYVPWVLSTVGDEASKVILVSIPSEGLEKTDLAPESPGLSTIARVSIFAVLSIIILAVVTALVVICTIRSLRHRRQQHKDGLLAEESFIYGGKTSDVSDPFAGFRTTANGAPPPGKAAHALRGLFQRRDRTQFSADGLSSIMGSHIHTDNAPSWLNNAWERLFHSPSRQDIGSMPSYRGSQRRENLTALMPIEHNGLGNTMTKTSVSAEKAQELEEVRILQRTESGGNNTSGEEPTPPSFNTRSQLLTEGKRNGRGYAKTVFPLQQDHRQEQYTVMSALAVDKKDPTDEVEVMMERPQPSQLKPDNRKGDDLEELRRVLKENEHRGREERESLNDAIDMRQNSRKSSETHSGLRGMADLKSKTSYRSGDEVTKNRYSERTRKEELYRKSRPRKAEGHSGFMRAHERISQRERDTNIDDGSMQYESLDVEKDGEGDILDVLEVPMSRISFDKGLIKRGYEDRIIGAGTDVKFPPRIGINRLRTGGRDVTDGDGNERDGYSNTELKAGSEVSFEKIDFGGLRPDGKNRTGATQSVDVTDATVGGVSRSGRPLLKTDLLQTGRRLTPRITNLQELRTETFPKLAPQNHIRTVNPSTVIGGSAIPETEVVGEGLRPGSGRVKGRVRN